MKIWMVGVITTLALSGCGGTYTVIRTAAPAPKRIEAVVLSPNQDNSQEMNGYMSDALLQQGLSVKMLLAAGVRQSLDVDAIVTYDEVWGWEIKTILSSLKINLYDAASGTLLVKGEWERASFHDYERGRDASRILLKQMFQKAREKP